MGWFGSFNEVGFHKLVVVVMLASPYKGVNGPLASAVAGNLYRNLSAQRYFTADGSSRQPGMPESSSPAPAAPAERWRRRSCRGVLCLLRLDSEVNFGEVAFPQRSTCIRARLQPCRNGMMLMGFSPCSRQGLKPSECAWSAARLKPCPDTRRPTPEFRLRACTTATVRNTQPVRSSPGRIPLEKDTGGGDRRRYKTQTLAAGADGAPAASV